MNGEKDLVSTFVESVAQRVPHHRSQCRCDKRIGSRPRRRRTARSSALRRSPRRLGSQREALPIAAARRYPCKRSARRGRPPRCPSSSLGADPGVSRWFDTRACFAARPQRATPKTQRPEPKPGPPCGHSGEKQFFEELPQEHQQKHQPDLRARRARKSSSESGSSEPGTRVLSTPTSTAKSKRCSWRIRRPRNSRDITVPTGMPTLSAMSL